MRLVTEEDARVAQKKVRTLVGVYAGISSVFVAAALLLLFLSPEKYVPFLVLDVILTAGFGVYSVYFFTISLFSARKVRNKIERALDARSETQFAVYKESEGSKTVDGVELCSYIFLVKGAEREYKTFEPYAFEVGKRYRIESGAGVVLDAEEENE